MAVHLQPRVGKRHASKIVFLRDDSERYANEPTGSDNLFSRRTRTDGSASSGGATNNHQGVGRNAVGAGQSISSQAIGEAQKLQPLIDSDIEANVQAIATQLRDGGKSDPKHFL